MLGYDTEYWDNYRHLLVWDQSVYYIVFVLYLLFSSGKDSRLINTAIL
jgi:hypothetical protein